MIRYLALFLACFSSVSGLEVPALTPQSLPQAGVPQGKVETWTVTQSKVYPETTRTCSLYIPAQYDSTKPAACMIFLDGSGYVKADGSFRVPTVFDNLIAAGKMPVTCAFFIDPGTIPSLIADGKARSTRSLEYDTPDGTFAGFLAEEMLPIVRSKVKLSDDPHAWGICGISSSGIAAFQVAWSRPDLIRKVVSSIGSFTNIRSGYDCAARIRASKREPKPLRLWLQDGESDVNNLHGNWPLANRDMASALAWAGYDHLFTMTGGGHSGQAGGALLPQALEWLWRKTP